VAGVDKVAAHCEDAISKGATVSPIPCLFSALSLVANMAVCCAVPQVNTGGTRLPEMGENFFAPTVLTNVPMDALVRSPRAPMLQQAVMQCGLVPLRQADAAAAGSLASWLWLSRAVRLC
jgi:hypothetical protein